VILFRLINLIPACFARGQLLVVGELQLNTGPDFEGKEFVTVFNAGGQAIKTYTIDPQ
jgi:hypothetical protein